MTEEIRVFTGSEHQPFDLGNGSAGAALLIHGFPGTPAELRGLGEWLAERGWLAKGILLPGFGTDIANLKDRTRCDWIDAAQAAWRELRKSNDHLMALGYSMGAAVALHLDMRPGDRLVLVAPFWSFGAILPPIVSIVGRFKPNLAPFKRANFSDPRLREQLGRILPDTNIDDPQVQEIIRSQFVMPLSAAEELMRIGREGYGRAGEIMCDSLLIQGIEDKLVKMNHTKKLVARLKHGKTTYIEVKAGHDLLSPKARVHLEVYQAVARFLETGEA